MKKKLLLFIMLLCTFFVHQNAKAQTLAPGDIAFVGYQTGSPTGDGFSFITLKAIPAGTAIYFTEKGWGNGVWANSTETHLLWNVPTLTPVGTIISIVETAADTFTITGTAQASVTIAQSTNFNLSAGDQILAYQSPTGFPEPASPTFIAGIHGDYNATNYDPVTTWNLSTVPALGSESSLPAGLTNGVNCISLFPVPGPEIPNSKYTGSLTGSKAAILASINNPANWGHHNTNDLGITPTIPTNYPAPSITLAVAPTVTSSAATSIKSVSATLGGDVTADGGDAIIERGIVWATTSNPTIANNKFQIGTGTGSFGGVVTGFPAATTIHYRAYATNSAGTSYGTELTFNTGAGLSTSATPQVNVACNGGNTGSASVTATGGTLNYSYSWSPSGGTGATASNLTAGNYTVTITDGEGTQITRPFTISEPPVIAGSPSTTAVTCFGLNNGIATISPTGGVGSYTYSWSPSGGTAATASGLAAGIYSVTITDGNSCSKTIPGITVGGPTTALTATSFTTPVSCFNGSNGTATVTAVGGTGTKTYLWSNGATSATVTGLLAGTYNVTVRDANLCSTIVTGIVVGGPTAAVSGTFATTPVSCFGGSNGSATVTPSGGVGGYTYSWSPSGGTGATASGLTAGTYSVTITDNNGCPSTITGITVGGPAAGLSGIASTTAASCFGASNGSATITVSGGTGTKTYLWSNGATGATASGLATGTYSVTVTDANLCSRTFSNISVGSVTDINPTPTQVNVSCNGGNNGSATVTPTGGAGSYTYAWSTGATTQTISDLAPGNYSVTIKDANLCEKVQSITITQPAPLVALTASTGVSCFGGSNGTASVTVSGGTPGYSYSWAPLGGTSSFISGRPAGDYTCTITDSKGCTLTQTITISSPTQITGTIAKVDVSCNGGTNGSATVTPSGGVGSYTYSWSPTGGNAATASGLAQGTYIVTIQDGNTCSTTVSVTIDQPTALTSSITKTDVLCNGGATGTATVAPLGGNGNYTYIWSPSGGTAATATGLTAGNYSCLVTDAKGCFVSQSVTIGEPAILSAIAAQIDATCSTGGQAAVNVSGGTLPYSYLWSSGQTSAIVTGLAAGSNSCVITDANGCTLSKNFLINTTNTLTAVTSKDDVLCNGSSTGSASVVPSGAPGPFTYVWSPSGGNSDTASNLAAGNYSVTITSANGCSIIKNFTIIEPTALSITPSQTNLLCNGATTGQASVSVTGGTGTYTYSWSPSGGTAATASGLTAGTYTVTVKDANLCAETQSFTITQPAALMASITSSNVNCNGGSNGSATVTATGGTGAYTYAWSPTGGTAATATGLTAGTYNVTITDANTCTKTETVTITEPAKLTASVGNQTDVSCNGENNGSANVNVNGGTGTYTYAWSPSGGTAATASGLSPGNYTVTVTDANSCTTSQNFVIAEPAPLVASVGSQNNVSCNGGTNGTASVNVTGGNGAYTYSWSPSGGTAASATGLTAGTYTLTVTDAKLCQATQSFIITEPVVLTASITSSNVNCNGGSNGSATVTATGGTGAYTYAWSPTGGTAATATGLTAGTYNVTITDANTCTKTETVTITEPAKLTASVGNQTDVSCNGENNGSANVNVNGGTGTYTYAWSPSGGTAATASGLSPGNYTVTVTDANSCTTSQNFVIAEPAPLVASVGSQNNVSCNGGTNGTASVNVTGGTGAYTYAWSPSGGTSATATGLTAGTYTVTVTDANLCQATQSFIITEPVALTASIASTNVNCNGANNGTATVTATGGTGLYTYTWSPTGGTAATASGLAAGTYTVTVTDANTCSITETVTITEPSILDVTVAQTDVTCIGAADATATVTATGGAGNYTYVWSPAGGTNAAATGLTAGNYSVTITDANGCQVTKPVTIITIPDVTAPIPNIATLPAITGTCSVVSAQIPVPTATDNCAGIINATTTDPLSYTNAGTHTITWTYNDGHGNTSSQNQTVTVTASPLDQVTFSDAIATFDGNLHAVQVANLPAGATVAYSITPTASTLNGAINAGIYTVTAIVSPTAATPNCSSIALTAKLTINKAAQQITFGAIPAKILGAVNDFNLEATSSSGLPIRYSFTYTSALPPANVSAIGFVNLLRSGDLLITAHQDGNDNYLPATTVEQLLVIKNNDVTVSKITLGNKVYQNPAKDINYIMGCDENNVNVAFLNETGATITPSANFTITTPKPGIYTQNVTVTSQDGTVTANYALAVEKPFGFYDIVHQKFNNLLLINNNPQTNGGYEFVSYQWFKNGQLVGTGQYYSAGDDLSNSLDSSADFSVKLTTKDGKILSTCTSKITVQKSLAAKLYPNPIQAGKVITVEADFPAEELANMQISLYSVSGQLIKTLKSSKVLTEIQLPDAESNMYIVVLETANIKKTLKVIVNK